MRQLLAVATVALAFATPSHASEPIVGDWRSPDGEVISIDPCGEAFCATVVTGRYSGQDVGRVSGDDLEYTGTVTDPRDERTYSGTIRLEGARLIMEGCALKVFCRSNTFTRL